MRPLPTALVLSLAIPVAGAVASPPAAALKAGQAKGKLTVNGETAQLTHAYLTPEKGSAGVVTLANIAVGPEMRNQSLMFEKEEPVEQGKLYLMNVKLDAEGKVVSCQIYHRKLVPGHRTSLIGLNNFEKAELSASRVRGRVFMKGPWKSSDSEEIFYDVTFDAAESK